MLLTSFFIVTCIFFCVSDQAGVRGKVTDDGVGDSISASDDAAGASAASDDAAGASAASDDAAGASAANDDAAGASAGSDEGIGLGDDGPDAVRAGEAGGAEASEAKGLGDGDSRQEAANEIGNEEAMASEHALHKLKTTDSEAKTATAVNAGGGQRNFSLHVDDVIVALFADGVEVDLKLGKNWFEGFPIPEDTTHIAVQAHNEKGWCGMLGADSRETLVTGGTWRCTNKLVEGWSTPSFNDTDWALARNIGSNGCCEWGPQPLVSLNTIWIWTSTCDDLDIYCRSPAPPSAE